MNNDKTAILSSCYILAVNFLLFFVFYPILPILPFYLREEFVIGKSVIRLILSYYTLAVPCTRPFAGCLLGTLARRPLYLVTYFAFITIPDGCMVATALTLSVVLRVMHGFALGIVTMAGDTILIDILSSSCRGEGIGYYGLADNIAMSFGPMTGLFIQGNFIYDAISSCSSLSGNLGFTMTYMVETPYKQLVKREPISLDRFFLVKGTWMDILLLLLSIPYDMTTTYVAMYAAEIGISVNSRLYSTFMAMGLAVSCLFSGRQVDKGRITFAISLGTHLAATTFSPPAVLRKLVHWSPAFSSHLYTGIALSQGVTFGIMFPAFNTLFVNLAPNDQRGMATSTYLTSWDVGIGIGLMAGSSIARESGGFNYTYLFGAYLAVLFAFFFLFGAGPHFNRYKLR